MQLPTKDLLGIETMTREHIQLILETADAFREVLDRPIKKVPTLRGRTVVTLFYEPSTRTRMSFELAAKRMGADVSSVAVASSSVQKGESLKDTVRTLEAMGADCIIMRHSQAGSAELASRTVKASVINGGDGAHEHPTQALLDLFTIQENKRKFDGLNVVMVGDIAHSRVARSNIWGLTRMGAKVTLVGPPTLLPVDVERMGVEVSNHLDPVIGKADVLYLLRIQKERQDRCLIPSIAEYIRCYGVDAERMAKARRDVLVMHPGPMNVGLEISEEVATSTASVIEAQVTNGVAVRMAVLHLLLGGRGNAMAA